jgi:hypothetical protein
MSRRIHVAVIVVVGMLIVFLAGLASSVLAGEDPGAGALGAAVQAAQDGPDASLGAAETSLTHMPLYFIENQGQLDEPVAYYVQGQDKTLYFTPQGVTFLLHGSAPSVTLSESAPSSLPSRSAPPVILRGAKPALPRGGAGQSRAEGNLTSRRWILKLDFVGANPDVQPVGQDETGALIS